MLSLAVVVKNSNDDSFIQLIQPLSSRLWLQDAVSSGPQCTLSNHLLQRHLL